MIYKVTDINVDYEAMGVEPSPRQTTLTSYILDEENISLSMWKKRPAVIVCPGGGYSLTACREAEPIALAYMAAGFHAFILHYSIAPSSWPAATVELSKAVMYVKEIADSNNIDKDNIYVCGFSAGGHQAATIGVHFDHPDVLKFSGAKSGENKPAGIILGYPVITGDMSCTHHGTINNFIGGKDEVTPLASLENYVTANSPEMFIFHTVTDNAVPVASALRLANALNDNGVNFEMHLYPEGPHGLCLSNEVTAVDENGIVPAVQSWINESIRWVKDKSK